VCDGGRPKQFLRCLPPAFGNAKFRTLAINKIDRVRNRKRAAALLSAGDECETYAFEETLYDLAP